MPRTAAVLSAWAFVRHCERMKVNEIDKQGTRPAPAKLAYSVNETAALIGVAPITIYRLLKRGLLKSSSALRTKIISLAEIERFLRETAQ